MDSLRNTVTTFEFPEGVRFSCTQCGDCCRGWHVMLSPGEVERLQGLDWTGKVPALEECEPTAKLSSGGRRLPVLARRDDGACVYLGERNQCLIHEHFGPDSKPLMCRLFPFGFFSAADRLAVDVSFACRAVSESRGEPLKARIPEWTRQIEEGAIDNSGEHRFSKKYRISGELLWELEHHLLELLGDRSMTLPVRLRAVDEFVRLALTADPRTENARTLRQVMAKGIPAQMRSRAPAGRMDPTERAIFFQLLYLALNPTPLNFQERSHHAQKREQERRVAAAGAYRSAEAHPWLDNRALSCSFADVETVQAGFLASPEGERLGEIWLKAKVIGQRFLKEGDEELAFVEAMPRLLLVYPLWLWTAMALAAERRAGSVGEEDARAALRLIDRSHGQISLRALPRKQQEAWNFALLETPLASSATYELLTKE